MSCCAAWVSEIVPYISLVTKILIVWQLRGWTPSQHTSGLTNYAQLITGMEGKTSALILCRSDGKEAPKYSDVQNLRDGRERLNLKAICKNTEIIQLFSPCLHFSETKFVLREDHLSCIHTGSEIQQDSRIMACNCLLHTLTSESN
jgi:hypothetical protein